MYFFYLKFSKSHTSQTRRRAGNPAVRFTTICLSNMPLNFLSSFEACLPYKITHLSNLEDLKVITGKGLFTIQNYTPLKRIKAWVCLALACLPYKITHLSNLHHIFVLKIEACLPYKITHLSNQHTRPIKHIAACLPYKITHLSNHDKEVLIMARGLFTIQNYTPLKLIYHLLNCKNCLTIIKNYTPLKLLSMRYPCVVV